MRCSQCGAVNKASDSECARCGVQFLDLRRGADNEPRGPASCAFDGRAPCYSRGIISSSTNGEGPWYCREHWGVLTSRPVDVRGNAVPEYQRMRGWEARDQGYDEWLKRDNQKGFYDDSST